VIRIKKDRAEGLSGGIEAKEHSCSFRLIPRRSSLNKKRAAAEATALKLISLRKLQIRS
jgi:hypothetical protein